MQANEKKRMMGYVVILILLAILAWWVFVDGNHDALKETELVGMNEPGAQEAIAVVKESIPFIDGKHKTQLQRLMYTRDRTQFEEITEPLFKSKIGPVEILGCNRMKHTSAKDSLSVYVRSEGRGQNYQFSMRKKNRKYVIFDITQTKREPSTYLFK